MVRALGAAAVALALAATGATGAAAAPTVTELTGGVTPGFAVNSFPVRIATGNDGNVWFTQLNDPGRVGRITPGQPGVTEFAGGLDASGFPSRRHATRSASPPGPTGSDLVRPAPPAPGGVGRLGRRRRPS